MKTVYHLHLNAYNASDKFFSEKDPNHLKDNHKDPSDVDGGWHHCAEDVETLAAFVHGIIHNDEFGITITRLIITRFTKRKSKDQPQYDRLIGWNSQWDANEEELKFLNSGFKWNARDKKKLSRFIVKSCEAQWKHWDYIKTPKGSKENFKRLTGLDV